MYPGVHVQEPSTALHVALFKQSQVDEHFKPYRPWGHTVSINKNEKKNEIGYKTVFQVTHIYLVG